MKVDAWFPICASYINCMRGWIIKLYYKFDFHKKHSGCVNYKMSSSVMIPTLAKQRGHLKVQSITILDISITPTEYLSNRRPHWEGVERVRARLRKGKKQFVPQYGRYYHRAKTNKTMDIFFWSGHSSNLAKTAKLEVRSCMNILVTSVAPGHAIFKNMWTIPVAWKLRSAITFPGNILDPKKLLLSIFKKNWCEFG